MNKKSVIKELEKARENLLDTEQLKAINYAIKIFEASSDLELLRIEAEHMALAFGENSTTIYDELTNTLRHINQEDIMKCAFINKLQQAKKEIEYLILHKAQFLTSDCKVCIDSTAELELVDKLILEIIDKLIKEYESEE
jgi:hypothetical protein